MNNESFTHLTGDGVRMVGVGDKPDIRRVAVAKGRIYLQRDTVSRIVEGEIRKGNVLTTSQIAAINAVKSTHHLIPLCHSLTVTGVNVEHSIGEDYIEIIVRVDSVGKTGVEMEALTGVSIGLLTVWDMVKSVEKDEFGQYPDTRITGISVTEKTKGILRDS